jgi:hypothetical protein
MRAAASDCDHLRSAGYLSAQLPDTEDGGVSQSQIEMHQRGTSWLESLIHVRTSTHRSSLNC